MTDLATHQQRVIAERDELDGRVRRLTDFLIDEQKSGLLPLAEHDLMLDQLAAMRGYLRALESRISLWNTDG